MHKSLASDPIRQQAAEWVVKLDAADCPEADREAFLDWLALDPVHPRVFGEAQQLWAALDAVPAPRAAVASVAAPAARGYSPRRRSGRARVAGIAAALVLALTAGLFRQDLDVRLRADARTAVGESTTLTLEDGSRIQLNTDSAVRVRYSAAAREIELMRGEAAFEVRHDPSRPFRVLAGQGSATALGTVYTVRNIDDGARVLVSEGRVRVRAGEASSDIVGGQALEYRRGALQATTEVDAYAGTAWRRGRISFVNQPLSAVVAELNRYYKGRILIPDAALASRPVSGVFETGKPLAALEALEQTLGIHAERYTSYVVVLRP